MRFSKTSKMTTTTGGIRLTLRPLSVSFTFTFYIFQRNALPYYDIRGMRICVKIYVRANFHKKFHLILYEKRKID